MTALTDTPQNRRRVEKMLEKLEAEITLGTFDYAKYFPNGRYAGLFASGATDDVSSAAEFGKFADAWFEEVKATYRRSQQITVRSHIDTHLKPFFGGQTVTGIQKADARSFRAHLASLPGRSSETLSASTINHVLSTLNMIMAEASDRYEFANPCAAVKRLKVSRTHVEPFNLGEVQNILSSVREDFKNYYVVRFFTGLRTAEIHGLKWQYVDFDRREILVRETIVQGRSEKTKNDGSEREVMMSQPVYDALKRQHEASGTFSEYVFCARNGSPISNNNVTKRVWYPLLRHLGLRKRKPYQTRHTAAPLWLAAGENPEWIARQMGHTSVIPPIFNASQKWS